MATIFSTVEIVRFRNLSCLRIENLASVNLLIGPNNSGKTSILEAIALLCDPVNFENWFNVACEREIKSSRSSALECLKWLFPTPDDKSNGDNHFGHIEMRHTRFPDQSMDFVLSATFQEKLIFDPATDLDEPVRSVLVRLDTRSEQHPQSSTLMNDAPANNRELIFKILNDRWPIRTMESIFRYDRATEIIRSPHFPTVKCQMATTVSHRTRQEPLTQLSDAVNAGQKDAVREGLQLLDPTISDVDIIAAGNTRPMVKISRSTRPPSPLASEGDGLRRLLGLTAAAVASKGGVLLIDEIESGIHTDALIPAFHYLVNLCNRLNVQLFVTTHSLEAVDALLAAMDNQPDDAAVYQLPRSRSDLPVKRLDGSTARRIRETLGSDLR